MAALRRAIREVDPETAIPNLETMEEARDRAVSSPRTLTSLFGLYAGLALVIAIAGIGLDAGACGCGSGPARSASAWRWAPVRKPS